MAFAKKISDYVPVLNDQGISHVTAAAKAGVGIQAAQITQAGASPFTVTFASNGMVDMEDANYVVIVGGETTGAVTVDQSTITTTGFDLDGGADTEVLHVLVVGRLNDQAA